MIRAFALIAVLMGLGACSDNSEPLPGDAASQYVLAFSWQPAFCETAASKPECKSQTPDRYDADHFSLHGLWPQPGSNVYCGVSEAEIARDKAGRWRDLDVPLVDEASWPDVQRVMPGTRSSLHKHEWLKHGTCSGVDINEYYAQSVWLIEEINGSQLQELFSENTGNSIDGGKIRAAFSASFGEGAGDRLRISCKRDPDSARQLIVELTLGLADPFEKNADLAELIAAAPKTDPGCPQGIVDGVGLQ